MRSFAKILVFLPIVLFLAGCISGPRPVEPIQLSNDIVRLKDYEVSTINPYPGSETVISFWLENTNDKDVTVTVDFFNVPSNLNAELSCGGYRAVAVPPYRCSIFLAAFDSKPVKLDMSMPRDNILSPVPYTIVYSINYTWTGYRSANVPIIDGVTRKEPTSQFLQSLPSYGPVHVEFQLPVGRTYKTDKETITEHWGLMGRSFEIKMNFKHVGNPQGDIEEPFVITPDKIKVITTNVVIARDPVYCAFDRATKLYPLKLEVPGELACNFEPMGTPVNGELEGIVAVDYTYNYKFTRTETIIEQPNMR